MYLRPKTTRRLLILAGVLVLIFAIGATMWTINSRRNAKRIAQARADAMAAFARGDHAAALQFFSVYLTASKTAEKAPAEVDAEALLAYGKSRQAIPLPQGNHLRETKNIFERYLQVRPRDREAQHLLLELYPRIRFNAEALALADNVLKQDPKDVAALRARGVAFTSQGKFKEAFEAYEQLLKIQPQDLHTHASVQSLFIRLARPGDERERGAELVKRYQDLYNANPDSARFELMLARAYYFAGDHDKAVQWLTSAANRTSADPEVAEVLTSLLERYSLFAESEQVLERLASSDKNPQHVRPLVRRMWQSGRHKDLLARTEDQDPASPNADTDLLAYRALALYDLNRHADAGRIVDALAARKLDMAAVAWAQALRARENENLAPRDRAIQYQEALERSPNNEAIHFFLGIAYFALGEPEPALRAWDDAARLAPSWSAPTGAIARTLAMTGRSAEALAAAEEAYRRAPRAISTTTGLAVAWFANLEQNPNPERQGQLLELVAKIQAQIPREPETLHIYVTLLSRTGQRDRAIAAIKSALDVQPRTPRETLLALASVSDDEKLGLEEPVLNYAERVYGLIPSVASRRAMLLAEAGRPGEGVKLMESARKADTKSDPTEWSLALLQYREKVGDQAVLSDWMKLGDANPDSTVIQAAILRSTSRVRDKAFWHRTIDRLKRLTGDEAVTPRVERARWLLSGEASEKDVSEAIVLLGGINARTLPEIHRLLGLAHEKSAAHKSGAQREELLRTAAEELQQALADRNTDASVASDLTRVYRAMGNEREAEQVMSTLAQRAAHLGIDGRRTTARTLIEQGQLQKAIEVLEPVGDGNDVARDALLCSLYRRTGQVERSAALYRRLLADERAEASTIADGADFFAGRKEREEAEKFLTKLKAMDIPAAVRELLLARFAERHDTPDAARQRYEAAVAADPAHAAAWEGLVGFHLRRLQLEEAVAAADRGLKAIPDDADLQSLRTRGLALETYKRDGSLGAMAGELSNDPQSGAVTDMLRILSEARKSGEPLNATLPKLRELADRNPDLLRLQTYVAEGHLKLKQYDQAEHVALRTSVRSPNNPDAARLLTMVYSARPGSEKWIKVLDAARQWRQRSLDNPLAADLAIARTLLEVRRPSEAVAQLKPHVSGNTGAKTNPAVLEVYALALIRSDEQKQASDLLTPLAKSDAAWRKLWLGLAGPAFNNAAEASRWIEQVAPMITSDSTEQVALAEAWCALAARYAWAPAVEKAKALVEPLTRDAKAGGADGWRLTAMLAESSGDMEGAVAANRKLLETHADDPDLQNNLAYALLMRAKPDDLPEARRLIEAALARQPQSSTYLDTLARLQLKSGDLSAAEKSFQRALDARSDSVEALIGLADVHVQAGRPQKAKELLVRINNALPSDGSSLPTSLQRQLDAIRQSVNAPVQSGRIE